MSYPQQQGQPTGYPYAQPADGYPMPSQGYANPNAGYGWKPNSADNTPGAPKESMHPDDTNFLDPESGSELKNMFFSDESIRKGFIRKVYLILMSQLLVTFGFVALFLYHEPLQEYTMRNPNIVFVAAIITLVVVVSMACCESARRTFPINFICLGIFTLAESFMVAVITSRYQVESVFLAVGITALLCLGLTIFATQTKIDFTPFGGCLLCALLVLFVFGIVGIFWHNHLMNTIYAGFGAVLMSFYLIYDTQMMMGGTHKYSISPEEYIFAAMNLYMDIVRIFIFILQLVGDRK